MNNRFEMKCPCCNGKAFITRNYWVEAPLYHEVVWFEPCRKCNGTGKMETNFSKITESPEALAEVLLEFQHKGFMARSEVSIVQLPTKQDIIDWLKKEASWKKNA